MSKNTTPRVVGLGDLLLSLAPAGYLRFIQAEQFGAFYTGAEANVCVSLARLGLETDFLTRLPRNDIADAAVASLRKYGVGTANIAWGGDRIGILYLEKGASQRASKVIYDRKHTAICEANPADFDFDAVFEKADWFHFTGITPALSDSMPAVCLAACQAAKRHGVTISCDLNFRSKLWTTEKAGQVMRQLLPYVDVLIANEEDVEKVLGIRAGKSDVESGELDRAGYVEVAKQLQAEFGITRIATTLRKSISASDNDWSALLCVDGQPYFSREYHVHIVNRVGGGDSFSAGLIYALAQNYGPQDAIEFAAAASCLKHTIENDFNLVSLDEIQALAAGGGNGRVQR
ncbi:MAG: sugar kinase [Clostridia bacterium]|nr:sugar kinase [Clostridia bacterium]